MIMTIMTKRLQRNAGRYTRLFLGLILLTFHEQLLRAQIPKVKRDSQVAFHFCPLRILGAHRTLMKLTPGNSRGYFYSILLIEVQTLTRPTGSSVGPTGPSKTGVGKVINPLGQNPVHRRHFPF
jgi:hypothetical protein